MTYSPPSAALQLPALPSSLSAVLEAKLFDPVNPRVFAVWWWFNDDTQQERLQFVEEDVSQGGATTLLYQYTNDASGGTVYEQQGGRCTSGPAINQPSPLDTMRDGFVVNLFAGAIDASAFGFMGQETVRGVFADYWSTRPGELLSSQVGGVRFSYSASVFFYPRGWQFPGIQLSSSSQQIPLRISTSGTFNNGTGNYKFQDTVDLFQVLPAAPDPSYFDPASLGCAAGEIDSFLNLHREGAIVAGSLIGGFALGGLTFLAVWFYRRRRQRKQDLEPIRLPDSTIDATPSDADAPTDAAGAPSLDSGAPVR